MNTSFTIKTTCISNFFLISRGTETLRVKDGNYTAGFTPAADCSYFSEPESLDFSLEPGKYYHVVLSGTDRLRAQLVGVYLCESLSL